MKGARLHRNNRILFVYSMVVMSVSGVGITALRDVEAWVIGGLLTAYLVIISERLLP